MSDATDRLTRFLIDRAGVRGVHVRLDEAWDQVLQRMRGELAAAPAAMEMLGEAIAAAALFTGHTKVDGRLSVQLRSQGPLRTLFAECTAAGTVRGLVRLAPGGEPVPRQLSALGDDSLLAITIENPPAPGRRDPVRYQGLVGLEADSLAGAFEDYFRQSEQLPTRLLLAAGESAVAGLMLQKLPGDEGDDDGWTRSSALFDTLTSTELLDVPVDTLLNRLFHEDGVQLLGGRALRFGCSCSAERVEAMLVSLGEDEALAAAGSSDTPGSAEITCEFCGQQYQVTEARLRQLLEAEAKGLEAPGRTQ
ncbi:Hsp33 family molecular chaperone HslO [Lysobacter sp. GX 14042]|uniref:Hsp33 family molecular chaperone HslO n=1 Tax=Lysobacter sp. GX 14042 TaxID=2907155 RepID=UPI0031BA90B2